MPVVAEDEFAALRSFCARTGVAMPSVHPSTQTSEFMMQVLRVNNMLAHHLEALENIVNKMQAEADGTVVW